MPTFQIGFLPRYLRDRTNEPVSYRAFSPLGMDACEAIHQNLAGSALPAGWELEADGNAVWLRTGKEVLRMTFADAPDLTGRTFPTAEFRAADWKLAVPKDRQNLADDDLADALLRKGKDSPARLRELSEGLDHQMVELRYVGEKIQAEKIVGDARSAARAEIDKAQARAAELLREAEEKAAAIVRAANERAGTAGGVA